MSRSFTCVDCHGRTEEYDDLYCSSCREVRARKEAADREKEATETLLAALLLERLGFVEQAQMLRRAKK